MGNSNSESSNRSTHSSRHNSKQNDPSYAYVEEFFQWITSSQGGFNSNNLLGYFSNTRIISHIIINNATVESNILNIDKTKKYLWISCLLKQLLKSWNCS